MGLAIRRIALAESSPLAAECQTHSPLDPITQSRVAFRVTFQGNR